MGQGSDLSGDVHLKLGCSPRAACSQKRSGVWLSERLSASTGALAPLSCPLPPPRGSSAWWLPSPSLSSLQKKLINLPGVMKILSSWPLDQHKRSSTWRLKEFRVCFGKLFESGRGHHARGRPRLAAPLLHLPESGSRRRSTAETGAKPFPQLGDRLASSSFIFLGTQGQWGAGLGPTPVSSCGKHSSGPSSLL